MDHSEWMIVNVLNGIACIPTFFFFILLWGVIENLHVVFSGSGDDKPKHHQSPACRCRTWQRTRASLLMAPQLCGVKAAKHRCKSHSVNDCSTNHFYLFDLEEEAKDASWHLHLRPNCHLHHQLNHLSIFLWQILLAYKRFRAWVSINSRKFIVWSYMMKNCKCYCVWLCWFIGFLDLYLIIDVFGFEVFSASVMFLTWMELMMMSLYILSTIWWWFRECSCGDSYNITRKIAACLIVWWEKWMRPLSLSLSLDIWCYLFVDTGWLLWTHIRLELAPKSDCPLTTQCRCWVEYIFPPSSQISLYAAADFQAHT